jgi:3-hydroxyacyl-CoA dehydrogenase
VFVFKAAVVGAGTMGGEIAQVLASADVDVVLKDVEQKFVDQGLEKAKQVTEGQIARLVKKEKITQEEGDEQIKSLLGRITGATEYEGFGDVDFVIEAVPERMKIKQAVFAELDEVTPGHAILASNTSSLSITEMGEATSRPDKVCGFHFFYPASMRRPPRTPTTSPSRSASSRSAAARRPASSSTASSTPRRRRSGGPSRRRAST